MPKTQNIAEPEELEFAGTYVDEPEPVIDDTPYDPTMDPSNPAWEPKKYFAAQPKEIVILNYNDSDLLGDPTRKKKIEQVVSINGYTLKLIKGRPTKVPRDFALLLLDIGAASLFTSALDAEEL